MHEVSGQRTHEAKQSDREDDSAPDSGEAASTSQNSGELAMSTWGGYLGGDQQKQESTPRDWRERIFLLAPREKFEPCPGTPLSRMSRCVRLPTVTAGPCRPRPACAVATTTHAGASSTRTTNAVGARRTRRRSGNTGSVTTGSVEPEATASVPRDRLWPARPTRHPPLPTARPPSQQMADGSGPIRLRVDQSPQRLHPRPSKLPVARLRSQGRRG